MSSGFVGTQTSFSTRHQRKDEAGMLPCSGGIRTAPSVVLTITGRMEGVGAGAYDGDDDAEVESEGVAFEQSLSWRRPEKKPEKATE